MIDAFRTSYDEDTDVEEYNEDFFALGQGVAYSAENPPYVLLDGGIRFIGDNPVGISTTLAGEGGITVGSGWYDEDDDVFYIEYEPTLTIHADQAYTGDTRVEAGAMLIIDPGVRLAGPLVVEEGGIFPPPRITGGSFVKLVHAPSYEGIPLREDDEKGNHFFIDKDGWLCYGREIGFTIYVR